MEQNYPSKRKFRLNLKQLFLTLVIAFSCSIIVGQTTTTQNFDFTSLSGGSDGQDEVSQTINENIINFKARIISNNYNYNPYILRIIAPDGTVYNLGASYDTSGTQFNSGSINETGGSWRIDVFEPVSASGSFCRVEFEYTYVSYDLDSDNDGILNPFEGGSFCVAASSTFSINNTRLNSSGSFNPYALNTQYQGTMPGTPLTGFAYNSFSFNASLTGSATWANGVQIQNNGTVGDHIYMQPQNTTPTDYAEYEILFPTAVNNFSFISAGLNNADAFEIYAYNGVNPINLDLTDLSNFNSTFGVGAWTTSDLGNAVKVVGNSNLGGVLVTDNYFTTTIPSSVTRLVIRSYKNNSNAGTVTVGITSMSLCNSGHYRDTDSDGIFDYLDLDSDNDGIYDAVEADHNQAHTSGVVNGSVGINGIPDAVETVADSYVTNYTIRNTDGPDANPDYIDLDSDGDGCSDSNEAYANGSLNDVSNQYGQTLGAVAPIVAGSPSTGLVAAAAYTVPANGDSGSGNLIPDYIQLSQSVVSIDTNPADQLIAPTNNAVFSVTATNGLSGTAISYQWQEQVNGVGPWNNITNGGVYSNATTSSLTISVVDGALDGNLYRAVVSSPSFACDSDLTSLSALLDVMPIATNDDAGTYTEGTTSSPYNVTTNDTTGDVVVASTVEFTTNGTGGILSGANKILTVPGQGVWTINISGEVVFTPAPGYSGNPTSPRYTVEDADGNTSNEATITLAVDLLPIATDDNIGSYSEGSASAAYNVTTNDTAGDTVDASTVEFTTTGSGGVLSAANKTLTVALQGEWTVNGSGEVIFTPVSGYSGNPTPPTYTVEDAEGNTSNEATITLNGIDNGNPIAVDDSILIAEGTLSSTPINAIGNDNLADGATYSTGSLNTTGTTGAVTDNNNGTFGYIPVVGFSGIDTFNYTICDNDSPVATCSTATVTVIVGDLGNPIAVNDSRVIAEGTLSSTPINAIGNDNLADGATYSIGSLNTSGTIGAVTDNNNGTFGYIPAAGFSGIDTFTYTICDNDLPVPTCSTATVTVIVTDTGNPLAIDNNISINEDTATATVINAIGDDNLIDDATYSIGSFIYTGNNGATITDNDDGTFDYTPAAEFSGLDSFSYTICDDDSPVNCSSATVFITVLPVNDIPSFTKGADEAVSEDPGPQIVSTWATSLSAGPANESGQLLLFNVSNDSPSLFSVQPTVSPSGELTYTPALNAVGTAIVTVSITDNGGTANGGVDTSATQTFNITISPINDAPVLIPQYYNLVTNEDTPSSGITVATLVGSSISDPDTAAVEGIAIYNTVGNGDWEFNTGSGWIQIPAVSAANALLLPSTAQIRFYPDFRNGEVATFSYFAWDQTTGSSGTQVNATTRGGFTAFSISDDTATIAVADVNDAPVLNSAAPTYFTDENTPIVFSLSSLIGDTIGEVDTNDEKGIAIFSLPAPADLGTWQYNIDSGVWVDFPTIPANEALLLPSTANIKYIPNNLSGEIVTFNYYAWDQTTGVSGTTADITSRGGTTAFSTVSRTATITVATLQDDSVITLSKVVSAGPYNVGDNVTFTVTVINNGPENATGIDVLDQLPSGYTYVSSSTIFGSYDNDNGLWDLGSLSVFDNTNAGTIAATTATLTVVATINASGNYTNSAEVTHVDQIDPNGVEHGNNTPSEIDQDDVTIIPSAITDLYTTKTVDNATPNTGDIVKYTLTVVNNGPSVAKGVSLVDNLPAGTSYVTHLATGGSVNTYTGGTWTIGRIDIGESATLTIDALVTAAGTMAQTAIVNTISSIAVIGSTDPTPAIDDDSASIIVTATDLVTEKSVSDPTPDEGQTIVYSIEVTNNGPSMATNVSLTDLLPSGVTYVSDNQSGTYNSGSGIWTIGTVGIGSTVTLNITATVNEGTSGDSITNNTTAASGDQTDPTTLGDDLTETITVNNTLDIVMVKTVDNATPNTGDTITYTVVVTNDGPALATNLVITDALPIGVSFGTASPTIGTWNAGVWTIGNLASGDSESITIDAIVTAAGTLPFTTLTNTATHAQDQVDSTESSPGDDKATADIEVTATNLITVKTVDDNTPDEGQTIVYTITVTNANGTSPATGVSLTDLLPSGVMYVSDDSAGAYNSGSGIWTIGTVANGSPAVLNITATVNEGTSGDSIINYTTAAEGDQTDPITLGDDLDEEIIVNNTLDIVLVKTVDNASPNTGETITYTVVVTNDGPALATNLLITDVLPVGLSFSTVSPSIGTWNPNTGTWMIGNLASGKSESITIDALVSASGTIPLTTLTNTATHAQDQIDITESSPGDDEATADIQVQATDLKTWKTVNNPTPEEGEIITYSITVTNNGPSPATGVHLTDLLPQGVTYIDSSVNIGVIGNTQEINYNSGSGVWNISNMNVYEVIQVGRSVTMDIRAKVNAGTAGSTIINSTTSATGDQTDPVITGDKLTATIVVQNFSDIVLTKVVDNPTPNVGDIVTYTITVKNNGPAAVTNLVINDALPTGLTYGIVTPSDGIWTAPNWNVNKLESGEDETLVIEAIVGMDQGGKTLTNVITNTQDQIDSNLTPDDATETIVVTSSDLVTVKTVSDTTPEEEDLIVYSIAVTNNGPSSATGVSLTDLLPEGVTYVSDDQAGSYNHGSGIWTIGNIANASTKVLNITAKVNAGTGGKTIVNATTAAKGDQSDPTTDGDDLTESITVENIADIVLTKVVDNATPNAGDTVTYTITVSNNGTAVVTNLVVNDALPTGLTFSTVSPSDGVWTAPNWTIGTLTPGEKETIVIKAVVGMDQGGKTLTNVISNTQDQVDTNTTLDDATATIVVTNSDLSVLKTVSNKTPNEGDTITYSIVVKNNGSSNATNVSLIDNLPVGVTYVNSSASTGNYNYGSGLWTIGNLVNGASATLTITATVDYGTLGKTITNTTSAIKADQTDNNPTDNIGSVAIVPTAFIDLSLTKTVVDDVVNPEVGDTITFEVRVNNDGPTAATGVQVTDLIPSGYDFVNYSSSIGTYNPKTGLWNIGKIEIGNTAVLLVDVIVLDKGNYINCAEVSKANEIDVDSTPGNGKATEDDYACASAPPFQAVDLAIVKTIVANNSKPMVNSEISFEIRLTNKGDIDATEVIVTDLLPSGYRFLNYSSSRGTYDYGTGKWSVGKLVNGETEILVVDAIVKESGDYLNCASITSLHQTDINTANNTSCIATTPIAVADLELTKDVNELEPIAESNIEFTVKLTNNGPSKGTGIVVKDLLPSGYTFVSHTASIGTYNSTTGLWNVGTIGINATVTLKIVAYVLPIGEWTNIAEIISANELDLDSTPGNNDPYEDDQASATTEPIVPITMPEGFTPNGDGINDVFEIEHLQVLYPNYSMVIVDRYGNKVYDYKHNGDPYKTPEWWSGFSSGKWNFNGDPLPVGTYFYTIYFNNNERKPQTGWIYLRR